MNSSGYVALVDTDRAELRSRISDALGRFDRLARAADPGARPPGSLWTVQQVVAHVLTVAHRYQQLARGLDFDRAATPRELDSINQRELEAAMAPVPHLAGELLALAPELDGWFDSLAGVGHEMTFHGGAPVSGITAQTNWLGELLMHGYDIARAVKAPWELPERDMALVARGLMEISPAYVRADLPPRTDACIAFKVPGGRPYLTHVHDGVAETRERRPEDRPDSVMWLRASVLTRLIYQRIGPMGAMRRGAVIVGGKRPWTALKLQSYFEAP